MWGKSVWVSGTLKSDGNLDVIAIGSHLPKMRGGRSDVSFQG